jgi:exopolysaccharide biosynthesis polyprenyl glycosylphosphotransferase
VVTVPTVLSSTAAIGHPHGPAGSRHAGGLLPLAGLAAAAGVVGLALTAGLLTWPVLAVAAGWPLVLYLLAGRPPAAGSLGRHHRLVLLRVIAAFALTQWAFDAFLGVDPLVLLTTVAALVTVTLAGTAVTDTARRRADVRPRTLVVGEPADLRVAMSHVAATAGREVDVVGGCTPAELAVTLDQLRPAVVVVAPSFRLSGRVLQRLAWQLERGPDGTAVPMLLLNGLHDVAVQRARPVSLGGLGLTEVLAAHKGGARGAAKVAWERVAAALTLAFLSPLLLGLAVLVRLDSPGPALFRQTRVGRDGRQFTMLKLRTMRTDAETVREELDNDVDEVLFKVRQDPRVTRIGRFLRRYSLDELPQLINVVRGDMSLVGPRPALPREVASYEQDPLRRLAVRPGLTGLWQVSGRSDLSWRESVRLDLDYVDNWSLPRDLSIVARTLHAVLGHRGAY